MPIPNCRALILLFFAQVIWREEPEEAGVNFQSVSVTTTGCGTTQHVSTKRCTPARTSNVSTEIVGARPERSHRVITFQDHDAEGNQNQNFPLAEKFGGRSTSHTASERLAGSRNHGVAHPYSTHPTEIES